MNRAPRRGAGYSGVRQEMQKLDATLPLYDVKTMTEHLGLSLFPMWAAATLLGSFGVLALLLAIVGVYGVVASSVTARTHEIGVRMALGAQPHDVLRLVVGRGMVLALAGVGLGSAASLGLTRFLKSLLFGVTPTDPMTFAVVSLLLAGVALLASYIPARRATKVDPMAALRYE